MKLYRGSTIEALNADEFSDNSIEGEAIDVWRISMTESEIDSVSLGQAVPDNLPGDLEGHEIVSVTGGLTSKLGTAVHFSQSNLHREDNNQPAVLYFDGDRIEGDILPVEYDLEWFNEHPGVLAHVDTLTSGEVWVNGELTGLVSQSLNEPPTVSVWRRNIEGRAASQTYADEEETVALAPEIDLDAALVGLASWYVATGPTVPNMRGVLASQDGYTTRRYVSRREGLTNVDSLEPEEMLEALHEIALERMDYTPSEYWSMAGDSRAIRKRDTVIDPDGFDFAYDGSQLFRSIDEVPALLAGREPPTGLITTGSERRRMSANEPSSRNVIEQSRTIRGPEDVDEEIRDAMCGAVARHVLAAAGEACNRRTAEEVADQLGNIDGVRVDRWASAENQVDDRDFIDLTVEAGARHSLVLLVTNRNGFVLEAIAGSWERKEKPVSETTLVLQYKR